MMARREMAAAGGPGRGEASGRQPSGGEGRPVRVGIVSFAHVHVHAYVPGLKSLPHVALAGAYDEEPARGRAEAQRYGLRFFERLEDLLEAVDAVVITAPNALHHRYTLAAVQARRHVLCEKPLATTVEHAAEMVRRASEAGVRLMTAFPMRFSPPVVTAKRAVASGVVGEVRAVTGSNNGRMPPGWFGDPELAGGGATMDHVVHLADIYRWLVGHEPVEVMAEAGTLLHEGSRVDDVAMVLLRFPGGVIGTIDASWSRPASYPTWGGLRFRVIGTEGLLDIDAFGQQAQLSSDKERAHRWVYWGSDADRAMLAAFVEAVRSGGPVPVSGEDGLAAVRVAVAAQQSAKSGQPVAIRQESLRVAPE